MPRNSKLQSEPKRLLVLIFVFFLFLVLCLELLSRLPCADIYANYKSPCYDLVKKYIEPKIGYFPLSFPKQKNLTYQDINNSDFFEKITERTMYVPLSEVRANGIACGMYAFVASELPKKAARYVSIHENIHLEGESSEAKTNYLAARIEPVGMVETVGFSIWHSVKQLELGKLPCQMGRLWFIFKLYFVNI